VAGTTDRRLELPGLTDRAEARRAAGLLRLLEPARVPARALGRHRRLSAGAPAPSPLIRRLGADPLIADAASSSAPRVGPGWGATSKTAATAEVMNSTRVWAARELRLRDRASTSLLIDTAGA